jgi:hypothetical protein
MTTNVLRLARWRGPAARHGGVRTPAPLRTADGDCRHEIAAANLRAWWPHPRVRLEHRTSSGHLLRWPSLALGALTFMAAHAVEVVMWTSWFGGAWRPFFMNAGQAVAFTGAGFLVAGFLAGVVATDRQDALIHAGNLTAGGSVAMTVILFRNGPGTLFPIAIVIGIYILGLGSYLGALPTLPFKAQAGGGGDRAHVR